jgi:hypothetical protein
MMHEILSQSPPYAYINKDGKLVGYALDLMEKIHQLTEIRYTIHLVKDGKYGSNSSGTWNGMVGELINGVSKPHSQT